MLNRFRQNVNRRIGETDPLLSMGQRAWDVTTYLWPSILAFFLTGSGVGALGYFTEWAKALGPLGIGLFAIISGVVVALAFSDIQVMRARRRLLKIQAVETSKWLEKGEQINPLEREFHTKRISLADIASPIDGSVRGKRIIDCELLGPRNLYFASGGINGCGFVNCDFVVVRQNAFVQNVTPFIETAVLNSVFFRCTIFMPKEMIEQLGMKLPIITLSGIKDIDDQPAPQPDFKSHNTGSTPPHMP